MKYFGESAKLAKTLNDYRKLVKEYGKLKADKIRARLDDFEKANTLMDISYLPPQRLHLLSGDRKNQFAVDISANFRLIFEGYDVDEKLTTQKEKIVILSVIEIEDYH